MEYKKGHPRFRNADTNHHDHRRYEGSHHRHDHRRHEGIRTESDDGLADEVGPLPPEILIPSARRHPESAGSRRQERNSCSHQRQQGRHPESARSSRQERNSCSHQGQETKKLPRKIISDCQCSYCIEVQQQLINAIIEAKRDANADDADCPADVTKRPPSKNSTKDRKQKGRAKEETCQGASETDKNMVNFYERIIATLLKALLKKGEMEKNWNPDARSQSFQKRSSSPRPAVAAPCPRGKMHREFADDPPQPFCNRRCVAQPFKSRPGSAPAPVRNPPTPVRKPILICPVLNAMKNSKCPYYDKFEKDDDTDQWSDKKIEEKVEDVLPVLMQLIATRQCHVDKIQDDTKETRKIKQNIVSPEFDGRERKMQQPNGSASFPGDSPASKTVEDFFTSMKRKQIISALNEDRKRIEFCPGLKKIH